jgi:adenylate cyclase
MGLIEDWHDRKIQPGETWETAIAQQLERAHLILLLISADFLDSRYCTGVEWRCARQRAQAGKAKIVPVLVRDCFWKVTELGGIEAVPRDNRPVTSWSNEDEAFCQVAQEIYGVVCNVKEFRADGSMCAWTSSQPDAAVRSRACLAALEALTAIERFSEHNAPLRLGVRLGLHAGRVFVGPAGGGGRFTFSIVGDIANTAARIEALNKQLGTRLLAEAEVVAGLDDVLVRPLGEFRLAGKHGVVSVVEIMGLAQSASVSQLSLCGRFPAAIQAVRERRWVDAAACFEAILRDHPGDGPSRFYLDQCHKEMTSGSARA